MIIFVFLKDPSAAAPGLSSKETTWKQEVATPDLCAVGVVRPWTMAVRIEEWTAMREMPEESQDCILCLLDGEDG